MEILQHPINKNILFGKFPTEMLFWNKNIKIKNEKNNSEKELSIVKNNPLLLNYLIDITKIQLAEMNSIDINVSYDNVTNVKINTNFEAVFPSLYDDYSKVIPVFTEIDKLFCILTYYYDIISMDNSYSKDIFSELLYLTKLLIKKEIKTGITINVDNIKSDTNLYDLIHSEWTLDSAFFSKLNLSEYKKCEMYKKKIEELNKENLKLFDSGKNVANETDDEWNAFIQIINKRAKIEIGCIKSLLKPNSPYKKKKIIYEYKKSIKEMFANQYYIKKEYIHIWNIADCIKRRFDKAPLHCTAYTKNSEQFLVHPNILLLFLCPSSYNHIFINYHLTRLDPSTTTFYEYFKSVIDYLTYLFNDDLYESKNKSNIELIEYITKIINDYYQEHRNDFTELKLQSINEDDNLFAKSIDKTFFLDVDEIIGKKLLNNENIEYEKLIEQSLQIHTKEQIMQNIEMLENFEKEQEKISNTLFFASIQNIIFMVTESIVFYLSNIDSADEDSETIHRCRTILLKINSKMKSLIYSDLDENEIDLIEYREKLGIDSSLMEKEELNLDKYYNSIFSETINATINELSIDIENKSTEELIEKKAQLKNTIYNLPECTDKEKYISTFESFSNLICDYLIQKQMEDEVFNKTKTYIKNTLGPYANILPNNAFNALITAEVLYSKYAASNNLVFDYSCISSLYYQSFESAYIMN